MERKKRRANGEGSVFRRKDGRWCSYITIPASLTSPAKRKGFYGASEAEVREKLERIRQQLGPPRSKRKPESWSFEAYARQWLWDQKEYIKPRTYELYEGELRNLVLPYIGAIPLVSVTSQHIRDMQYTIAATGKRDSARRSRKSAYRVLQAAFIEGYIPRNPAEGAKPVRHKPEPKETWNAEEVQAFLTAAEDHPYYAMFYTALMTGLRPSELYALEWDCVLDDQIHVRQTVTTFRNKLEIGTPKTEAGQRYVPLPRDAKAVLDAYAPEKRKGYVFPSARGTLLNPANVRFRMFLPLLEKAGLKPTQPYTMRHTYASMQIAAGIDVAKLAKWMGHGNPNVTLSYYVHAFEQRGRQQGLTLAELLGTTTGEREAPSGGVRVRPDGDDAALAVRVSSQELAALLGKANGKDIALKLVIED
jgi:integrase